MKIINLTETNPYLNLAIEEYLFLNSEEDVFLLWQNSPTVVIGKNQNVYNEIDFNFLKSNNILIARRITGGGAVYHDFGNLNFSFISVSDEKRTLDFNHFTELIIEALNSFGIDAKLSGRNDILVNDKKISGNAQCTQNGRVLHHGTLLYDTDFTVLSSVLKPDERKIQSKAIKSVRSRVANISEFLPIKYSVQKFRELLLNFVAEKLQSVPSIIELNDEIFGSNGKIYSVQGIFPQGIRPIYQVKFSDNTVCECDLEHLWIVKSKYDLTWQVKTLKDIIDSDYKKQKYTIPTANFVRYKQRKHNVSSLDFGEHIEDKNIQYIPDEYKIDSYLNRKRLIQGLLNKNGELNDKNEVFYITKHSQLAKDIQYYRNLGKSYGEIAKLCNCAKSTVAYHCKNGVRNQTQKYSKNRRKTLN